MNLNTIISLYEKYANELKTIKQEINVFYNEVLHARGGLDDIEAEITYMLVRENEPKKILEVSPCFGYSTYWILKALELNGIGRLYSYDLINDSKNNIPDKFSSFWNFEVGDVQTKNLDDDYDFVFWDSEHNSESFTLWYLEKLKRFNKDTIICIHDIFSPELFNDTNNKEISYVLEFIAYNKYNYFTASSMNSDRIFVNNIRRIKQLTNIHHGQVNPMIWLRLNKN